MALIGSHCSLVSEVIMERLYKGEEKGFCGLDGLKMALRQSSKEVSP